MGSLIWDFPMLEGRRRAAVATDKEDAPGAEAQLRAARKAACLLDAGLVPPADVEETVAFIEIHGARVYLALKELLAADDRWETDPSHLPQ